MTLNIPQLTAVAAAVPWLACVMVYPRVLSILVVLLSLIQLNWFARYFGAPAIFSRISLVVAGLLGIRLIIDFSFKKEYFAKKWLILAPVLWLACFFLVLTVCSNLFNGESLLLGLYDLRYYFFGLVICFSLYFYFEDLLSITFFKQTMIWIGLLQVPFSIIEWIVAKGGRALTLDAVTGTFSGYGELVACQLLVICIVLYEEMTTKKKFLGMNNYFLCLIFLIPIILSKSRTATGYVILGLCFTWFLGSLQKKSFILVLKQTIPICLLGIGVFVLLYQFFWKPNYDVNRQFNLSYAFRYYMREPMMDYENYLEGSDPVMGRGRAVVKAIHIISEHPINLIIGYGSGATAEASFLGINGLYYQKFGTLAGLGRNQYSKTIAEFGLLGMGGFIFFFAILYCRIKNAYMHKPEIKNIFTLLLFSLVLLSVYAFTLTSFFFSFTLAFFLSTVQADFDRINACKTTER